MSAYTPDTLLAASPDRFQAWYGTARELSDQIREATSPYTFEPGTRHFLTDDGFSGFAIRPDGELVFVFSGVRGRGDALIKDAIRLGATHLDCFAGYLTTLYGRHGFVETDRQRNWTPGGPDVVWMSL